MMPRKQQPGEYQSEKLLTSLFTRELNDLLSVRVKMKVSSANGYLQRRLCISLTNIVPQVETILVVKCKCFFFLRNLNEIK